MVNLMNRRNAFRNQAGNDQTSTATQIRCGNFASIQRRRSVDHRTRNHDVDVGPHLGKFLTVLKAFRINRFRNDGLSVCLRQQCGKRLLNIRRKSRIRQCFNIYRFQFFQTSANRYFINIHIQIHTDLLQFR